jgi:hypothetical protein
VVRAVLLVAGTGWLLAGLAALVVSLTEADALVDLLPPLAIDTDAVAGAAAAIGAASVSIGIIHAVVVVGLARGVRWAWSAGILLAGVMVLGFGGTGLAAGASLLAGTVPAGPGVLGVVGAAALAIGYGLVGTRLTRGLASGTLI